MVGAVGAIGAVQQGVAIGPSTGHALAAHIAASTGFVVDHDGLAQKFAQLGRDRTRQVVRTTPGWEGHDQLDGFAGIGLGPCRGRNDSHG